MKGRFFFRALRRGLLAAALLSFAVTAQCPVGDVLGTDLQRAVSLKGEARIAALDSLLVRLQNCPPPVDSLSFAQVWHQLGVAHYRTDPPRAIEYTRLAIRVRERRLGADHPEVGQGYFNLGVFQREHGQFSDALQSFGEARARYQRAGDARVNECHFEQAKLLRDLGDYEQALENVKLAESGAVEALDLARFAMTEGVIRLRQEDYAGALAPLRSAGRVFAEEEDDTNLAKCWLNTGNAYDGLERADSALYAYRQALRLLEGSESESEIKAYLNLGFVLTREKRTAEAKTHLDRALELCSVYFEGEKNLSEANVRANLGDWYLDQGQPGTALEQYLAALAVFPFEYDRPGEPPGTQALALAPSKSELLVYLLDVAKAHRAKGGEEHLRAALEWFRAADELVGYMRREQLGARSKRFWRSKTQDLYAVAVAVAYELGDVQRAFYFMEKSRAILLLDELRDLNAHSLLPEDVRADETALKQRVRSLSFRLEAADLETAPALRAELLAATNELSGFIQRLEREYPDYHRLKYADRPLALEDVQRRLGPREAFVEHLYFRSDLYALYLDAGTARLTRTPAPDYGRDAREWLSLLADARALQTPTGYARQAELAHALYLQLFAPLQAQAEAVTMASGDYLLPFEALLPDPGRPQEFLLHRHSFNYAYSATIWLTQYESRSGSGFVGFAPVEFPRYGLPDLVGTEPSLERLRELMGGDAYLRGEATAARFREEAPRYGVLQLYTHALADHGSQREPVIFFSDTLLGLSDLYLLPNRLHASLAVLSACSTGAGEQVPGEGVMSLARGFAAAGIASCVTTLWEVNADATVELTELFYGHLKRGMSKAMALRQAKLDYLDRHAGTASTLPTFWAGMVHLGSDGPLPRPFRLWWVLGIVTAVLAVAVFGALRRLKKPVVPRG
jgi:tetratricopeptide (TPR) repeat protein